MNERELTSSDLGSWAGDDFEATVNEFKGIGSDHDIPKKIRFVAGVAKLLLRRAAEAARTDVPERDGLAIFVLRQPGDRVDSDAVWFPMLDNGMTPLTGHLWVVGAAVISGHQLQMPDLPDAATFALLAEKWSFENRPTLVYETRTESSFLRWYPRGTNNPDECEIKQLDTPISPENVRDAIDRIYCTCLIAPSAMTRGGNVWESARRCWPKSDAEPIIQAQLKAGLVMAFPQCSVRHEDSLISGRTDLDIELPNPIRRRSSYANRVVGIKSVKGFHPQRSISSGSCTVPAGDRWSGAGGGIPRRKGLNLELALLL